ncbi:hypothetical protein D3C85_1504690 [compost metagenome]
MQAVVWLIGKCKSILQGIDLLQDHDRAEYLLLPDLALRAHVFQYRWVKQRAFTLVTCEDCAALFYRILNRVLCTLRGYFRDHWADIGGLISLITND